MFCIFVTHESSGLQTKETIDVPQGGDIVLPCSLPQQTSWRVVGGKWKADHLAEVSSTVLKITDNTLQWMGQTASRVVFASGQLNINYDMKLTKVNVFILFYLENYTYVFFFHLFSV